MFRKIISILGLTLLVFITGISVSAAQFESGDNPSIVKSGDNLNVFGGQVEVSSDTKRDLVVAGGTVLIKGKVERSLLAASGNLRVESPEVGATARLAGGTVDIEGGKYNEDVFIAGGKVVLRNVTILGDLSVATGDLTLDNSTIKGNLYGAYENLDGDLKEQVAGTVFATKTVDQPQSTPSVADQFSPIWEFGIVVFLILLVLLLARAKKLETKVSFDGRFGLDLLLGFGLIFLPVIIVIFSAFLMLFPVVIIITLILYLCSILSVIYLPIYLANILKNSFKITIDFRLLVALSYLGLLLWNIPVFYFMPLQIVTNVLWFASVGYLARKEFALYVNAFFDKNN